MRTLTLFILLASSAFLSASSLPINTSVVEKSIVFLWYARPGQQPEGGTGFLLEVPLKNDPKKAVKFIITARHIVDPAWAGCSWSFLVESVSAQRKGQHQGLQKR